MRPVICVFSPCPVLTVTIEDDGEDEASLHLHAGGQGVWVARMAATLGADAVLCCATGGEPGQVMEILLQQSGIRLAASTSADPSPGYVHDRRGGERVTVAQTPGPRLSRHEADELYNIVVAEALAADVVVLTGQNNFESVPADMYQRLSHDLRSNDVRTVADLSGDDLAELEHADVLKVAHDEIIEAGDVATDNVEELVVAMEELVRSKAANVVVSRAEKPAIASFGNQLYEIEPPSFEAIEHRGAGDSMTAALAVGLARGLSDVEMLQLAAAAGAINVTRRGLGSGHRESIEKIAQAVSVRPLALKPASDERSG